MAVDEAETVGVVETVAVVETVDGVVETMDGESVGGVVLLAEEVVALEGEAVVVDLEQGQGRMMAPTLTSVLKSFLPLGERSMKNYYGLVIS